MSKPVVQDLDTVKNALVDLLPLLEQAMDAATFAKNAMADVNGLMSPILTGDQEAVQWNLSHVHESKNLNEAIRVKIEELDGVTDLTVITQHLSEMLTMVLTQHDSIMNAIDDVTV